MMKSLSLSLILCFIVFNSLALTDTLKTDTTKTSLTLATIYSSNANYHGQTTEEKLPYVLSNATVRLKNGFSFSIGAFKLLNYGGGISETNLGAGYHFNISKKVSSSLSYSHSFYPQNSPFIQAANDSTAAGSLGTASASFGVDWGWFSTSLNSSYAFSQQEDVFLSLSSSKFINLGRLFSDKDYLSLEPTFEIEAGTKYIYSTYIQNQSIASKITHLQKKLRGLYLLPQTPRRILEIQNIQNDINDLEVQQEQDKEKQLSKPPSTSFDLLSYNLTLPLSYNRTHYFIEASYQASILGKNVVSTNNKPRSFFNLSFYYLF